jgi:hypothetical protein
MSSEVKLICGIETSQSTVVNITAGIEHDAPQLSVITRNGCTVPVSYVDDKWTTTLAAGQHILVIKVNTEDEWFEDEPQFELSQNAKIVIHLSSSNSVEYTQVWQADTGVASDPKDPWPPPGTPVSMSDKTWFASVLSDWYTDIYNPRGTKEILDASAVPGAH